MLVYCRADDTQIELSVEGKLPPHEPSNANAATTRVR